MSHRICWRLIIVAAALLPLVAAASGPGYRMEVDGLACPFCSYGIEKQFRQLEGVESMEVDIEAGTLTVTMAEGAELTRKEAARTVDRAGFTLAGFEAIDGPDTPEPTEPPAP